VERGHQLRGADSLESLFVPITRAGETSHGSEPKSAYQLLLVHSLQERYGVRKEDLVFFLGHVEADSEESGHSGEGWEMVRLYANTDEAQENVLRAVRESLAMYWLFMDGINRATEG